MADLKQLKERWPSAFVARSKVGEFSGGILCAGTLANADSAKVGPKHRVRIGRKVAYPVDSLIEWLETRMEAL